MRIASYLSLGLSLSLSLSLGLTLALIGTDLTLSLILGLTLILITDPAPPPAEVSSKISYLRFNVLTVKLLDVTNKLVNISRFEF